MPKYIYKAIKNIVEETYAFHTGQNIYDALGDIDFDKATLVVIADTEEASEALRKGITDIRMWQLESIEE